MSWVKYSFSNKNSHSLYRNMVSFQIYIFLRDDKTILFLAFYAVSLIALLTVIRCRVNATYHLNKQTKICKKIHLSVTSYNKQLQRKPLTVCNCFYLYYYQYLSSFITPQLFWIPLIVLSDITTILLRLIHENTYFL